jgi:hypothetical protein
LHFRPDLRHFCLFASSVSTSLERARFEAQGLLAMWWLELEPYISECLWCPWPAVVPASFGASYNRRFYVKPLHSSKGTYEL